MEWNFLVMLTVILFIVKHCYNKFFAYFSYILTASKLYAKFERAA